MIKLLKQGFLNFIEYEEHGKWKVLDPNLQLFYLGGSGKSGKVDQLYKLP